MQGGQQQRRTDLWTRTNVVAGMPARFETEKVRHTSQKARQANNANCEKLEGEKEGNGAPLASSFIEQ